jgi:hypothetical protein
MVMRYHWGLGVGHIYACTPSQPDERCNPAMWTSNDGDSTNEDDGDLIEEPDVGVDLDYAESKEYELDLRDSETGSSEGSAESDDLDYDGSELFELDEMYGDSQGIDFYG